MTDMDNHLIRAHVRQLGEFLRERWPGEVIEETSIIRKAIDYLRTAPRDPEKPKCAGALYDFHEEFQNLCRRAAYSYSRATGGAQDCCGGSNWEAHHAEFDDTYGKVTQARITLEAECCCTVEYETIRVPFWLLDMEEDEQYMVMHNIHACVQALARYEREQNRDAFERGRVMKEKAQLEHLLHKYGAPENYAQ